MLRSLMRRRHACATIARWFACALLSSIVACSRHAEDPEAAVRFAAVKKYALAEDAGSAWYLTSNDEVFFDDGWYPMETDKRVRSERWRWMGRRALTRLRTHEAPMQLRITGWVPLDILGSIPAMTVRWNGAVVDAFVPPAGRFTRTIVVPANTMGNRRWGDVVIETSSAAPPPDDLRDLGYALAELRWEPAGP